MNLPCTSRGKGDRSFIFLHGNSLNSGVFKKQLEQFSRYGQVVCFDLPGHGASDYPVNCSISLLSEILIENVNAVSGDKHIVAHSLSGHLLYQNIHKLHPIGSLTTIGAPPLGELNTLVEAFSDIGKLMLKPCWTTDEISLLAKSLSEKHPNIIHDFLFENKSNFREALQTSEFFNGFRNEIDQLNKHSGFRINVVLNEDDKFLNKAYAERVSEIIDNSEVLIMKGDQGGHMPFLDDPQGFQTLLLSVAGEQIGMG